MRLFPHVRFRRRVGFSLLCRNRFAVTETPALLTCVPQSKLCDHYNHFFFSLLAHPCLKSGCVNTPLCTPSGFCYDPVCNVPAGGAPTQGPDHLGATCSNAFVCNRCPPLGVADSLFAANDVSAQRFDLAGEIQCVYCVCIMCIMCVFCFCFFW